MKSRPYQKVSFGDLPTDGQEMLTRHLAIDFSHAVMKAPRWFCAWARNSTGDITGIFAAEFCVWFDAKITVLVLDPHCLSRRVLRAIFTAVFSQAKRLTAEVEPGNLRSLKQVQRLGFHHEGYRPLGLEGERDTILFGMVKDECPWLRSYLSKPFSAFDVTDVRFTNAVIRRDFEMSARVRAHGENLGNSKSRLGTGFHGERAFEQVLFPGLPADMSRVDANAVTAGVSGVQLGGGRLPVRSDADHAVNAADFSTRLDVAVPVRPYGMRPKETAVASIRERGGNRLGS